MEDLTREERLEMEKRLELLAKEKGQTSEERSEFLA
jgi:hypothetical protein